MRITALSYTKGQYARRGRLGPEIAPNADAFLYEWVGEAA